MNRLVALSKQNPGQFGKFTYLFVALILVAIAVELAFESRLSAAEDKPARGPNVVLILADDLGWSDTTLFGTTKLYQTPSLAKLAARGMTFTRAYASSPLCSPTRASLLTGLSPARIGITAPTCHLPKVILKASVQGKAAVNQMVVQPASATRFDTSYYTLAEMFRDQGYATGHFGKWHLGPAPYSPLEHGFDVDVPHWPGPGPAGSYVAPWKFPDFDPNTPTEHIEDRMAQEAVAFLEKHRDEPFFLNYWMFSVHAPFNAKQKLIDQYKAKIDSRDEQRSPTYAAMIESMDDAIGTLLDTLDRLKIADNTIIIFASDNGGNMYNEVDGTTPTSNRPLRGGKATMYEGGIRGPAIVAYPPLVKAASRSDAIIQSSDFYPTLLELLAVAPQDGQTFDGISIAPALRGESLRREAIFTYFPHAPPVPQWMPPAVSVHAGDWKLIRIFHSGKKNAHRYQLYNLKDDIGEQNDLSAKLPDRVRAMDAMIEKFLAETNAVTPIVNTAFDPEKYRPELEGVGRIKGSKPTPKPRQRPTTKPVAGWRGEGGCVLTIEDNALVVKSINKDPHLSYSLPKPIDEKQLVLSFTMLSKSSGGGQIFWQEKGVLPGFARQRSKQFEVRHDGKSHEYQIAWSAAKPVIGVRIDPSAGPGKISISAAKLTDANGQVLFQWKF